MAYDADTFPRIAYHAQLSSYGHLGHPFITTGWLENQISLLYPRSVQFMWSIPPYCVFMLEEHNEPSVETCELMDMTTNSILEASPGETLITLCFT